MLLNSILSPSSPIFLSCRSRERAARSLLSHHRRREAQGEGRIISCTKGMKHLHFQPDPGLYIERPYQGGRLSALRIIAHAIEQADPGKALRSHLSLDGANLRAGGNTYDLRQFSRILVTGAGKAGASMAAAINEMLGNRVWKGSLNVPPPSEGHTGAITLHRAGHPLPDRDSMEGTRQIIRILEDAGPADLVICLISGGASALMTLPEEGLSLQDMADTTGLLLRSGAPIEELNTVRKHLCQVKGGKCARLAAPSQVISFILSDVVGNRADIIASGPTVPDSSTFHEALEIIARRGLEKKLPETVMHHLRRGCAGAIAENPGPGDPCFTKVNNIIIGGSDILARSAVDKARELSFNTLLLTTSLEGEAAEAGHFLASLAREIKSSGNPVAPPACVIAAGETTVTVRGTGLGGRNQELALSAALFLNDIPGAVLASCASDGMDGPTDAAGAVVDAKTAERGKSRGLAPLAFLAANDSYHFLEKTGDLIKTGMTGTNVNDIILLLLPADE